MNAMRALAELSIEEAIARTERAITHVGLGRAALATDGDGTLWTHDIGEALFDAVLDAGLVGEPARAALVAEADAHGVVISNRSDATAIARELFEAYVGLRFPEDRMCAAMSWCMAGVTTEVLDRFCAELLEGTFGLRHRLIAESNELLRYLSKRGVPVWLVSASPRAVVEAAAKVVAEIAGIDTPRVIAMTPRVVASTIAPATDGPWPYGEGKRAALEAELDGRVLVAAMGDNAFDVAMLRAARVPLAIRPKPALVHVAADVPALMRLATR